MVNPMLLTLLADVPGPGEYFNLVKLAVVMALFIATTAAWQWVDRDTDVVKTMRERWNIIVLMGGMAGLLVLFLFPWSGGAFFIGLGFWIALCGGTILVYVMHRNGRVVPDQRVLTLGHVKRMIASDGKQKSAKVDRGQRIHLADHEGSDVERPVDRDEFERYSAAQDFIFDLLWRRASDADVVCGKEATRVVYKIDGVASERNDVLTPDDAEHVILFLKSISGLNPEEIRRPQHGHFRAALLGQAHDMSRLDVMTSGSTLGERMRIKVQQGASRLRIDELGMAPARLEHLKKLVSDPKGLVVVSGPKGGGVTTTQYAILRSHDAFMQNIHLLERKTLHEIDNITQVQHEGASSDISYARQLQSVLRREPDIVGVGDCEDRETAQIALRAATNDRKVYMVVQGKNTFDALSRLMGLAEDNELVAKGVVGVIAQRLVRTLCMSCRQSFKPEEKLLRKINLPVDKIENFHRPPTEPVFDRKGNEIVCQTCQGSGYVGRTGVFELLIVDKAIRQLIAAGAPTKLIKAQARKSKMLYMQEEGLLKVIEGVTSLDEIIRGLRDDPKK
jgi:type II secretory ATPase GspE/PulE/Tfp pilus assembly ATPase PilB-like protein